MIEIFTILASSEAPAEEAGGIAALGIDPLAILAQAITFLLLFWIIKKFALEKIVATLEARRKTIDDGVRLGFKMEAEHAALEEKIDQQLRETRVEADRIISEAHKESGEIIKEAEKTAGHKVETMLEDARAKTKEDMKRARKELERDIVGLVADATEVIIGEKLDARKDAGLIDKALSGAKR